MAQQREKGENGDKVLYNIDDILYVSIQDQYVLFRIDKCSFSYEQFFEQ